MSAKPSQRENLIRTCREEGWCLSSELLKELPPIAIIMRTINPAAWDEFEENLRGGTPMFCNSELGVASSCDSWDNLADCYGIKVFDTDFRLPADLTDEARTLARQIRNLLMEKECACAGGCTVFWSPATIIEYEHLRADAESKLALAVMHDGGSHASFFNWAYGRPRDTRAMANLFALHGFWSESYNQCLTLIYRA